MHDVNLRRLQHLVALAEEKSFAKAAARVHLSQPALTRSIQALERDMDMQLCDRGARGIVLTSAGRMIVERARRVLFEARCLQRDAELVKNHELGEVSFGVGPYPAVIYLSDVLSTLGARHPKLQAHAEVNNWTVLLERLHAETIEFFVAERRTIPPAAELDIRTLPPQHSAWFVRAGHPLLKARAIPIERLRDYPLVSVPLPAYSYNQIRKALGFAPPMKLEFRVECNDFFVLKELVQKGDAVLFGPESSVQQEVAAGRLVEVPIADPAPFNMQFAIVRLAQRTLSPGAEKAIDAFIAWPQERVTA